MKYFVYYDDDYNNMGGSGLKAFEDNDGEGKKAACAFIEKRMKMEHCREHTDISNYMVIRGEQKIIIVVEKVEKVEIV